ncbi:MAG: hypothetical protein CL534_02360 [Ahrensia sp.]|nr:hypothetical protein [Ahrensia sp.]
MDQGVVEFLKTDLSIIFIVIGVAIGMGIERFRSETRRRAWRERNRWKTDYRRNGRTSQESVVRMPRPAAPKPRDAADQLRTVMSADFEPQPILNKREGRVFRELDVMVIERNPGWQVMAQVSLGEILRCRDTEAYSCINSKRVDLVLMDEDCQARFVIEYQGDGHHQGTAAARDAVKKEALRRAGIGYHEVVAGHTTPSELRLLVEKLVPSPAEVPHLAQASRP